MPPSNVFTATNFPLPAVAGPPLVYVPGANGGVVQNGHANWQIVFDTTGLPDGVFFVDVLVQYRYTNIQLGVTGLPNQGQLTNLDGTVTQITGQSGFSGWLDAGSTTPDGLNTTYVNKQGQVVHSVGFGLSINLVQGAYPDRMRAVILRCPGWANVASASLTLN